MYGLISNDPMNNRKQTFLLPFIIFLVLISGSAFSQSNIIQDVVYLKNGSIIRGKIIEFIPQQHVKIETIGKNVFVYKMEEVEKITEEEYVPDLTYAPYFQNSTGGMRGRRFNTRREKRRARPFIFKDPGLTNITTFGLTFSGGWSIPPILTSVENVTGYTFSPILTAGIGVGINNYDTRYPVVPIFAHIRGDFRKEKKATPFYYVSAGKGFNWLTDNSFFLANKPGVHLQGGIGYRFYSRSKYSTAIDFGYHAQQFERSWENWSWQSAEPVLISQSGWFQRTSLRWSIIF